MEYIMNNRIRTHRPAFTAARLLTESASVTIRAHQRRALGVILRADTHFRAARILYTTADGRTERYTMMYPDTFFSRAGALLVRGPVAERDGEVRALRVDRIVMAHADRTL